MSTQDRSIHILTQNSIKLQIYIGIYLYNVYRILMCSFSLSHILSLRIAYCTFHVNFIKFCIRTFDKHLQNGISFFFPKKEAFFTFSCKRKYRYRILLSPGILARNYVFDFKVPKSPKINAQPLLKLLHWIDLLVL